MASPTETGGKFTIPGKPVEVDVSCVHGDLDSGIRSEFTGREPYLDQLPGAEKIRETIENGERVFLTGNDEYLFFDPPPEVRE